MDAYEWLKEQHEVLKQEISQWPEYLKSEVQEKNTSRYAPRKVINITRKNPKS